MADEELPPRRRMLEEFCGEALFQLASRNLEGLVAKWKDVVKRGVGR